MMVEYDLTVDDVIAQKLSHDRHSAAVQRSRLGFLWIPTAFLLLFSVTLWVFEIIRNPNSIGPSQDVAVIFGLGVLYFLTVLSLLRFYLPSRTRRMVRRLFVEGKYKELLGSQRITLSAEGISTENDAGTTSRPWSTVEQIAVGESDVSLYCNGIATMIVPRRVFATDAEFGAFVETVRQYEHPVVTKYTVHAEGQISLEYELTLDDLVAFGIHCQDQSPSIRRLHFRYNGSELAILLMFPVFACFISDPHLEHPWQTIYRHGVLFLFAPLCGLVLLVYYKFFYRDEQRRLLEAWYSHEDNRDVLGPQKVLLSAEGFQAETRVLSCIYQWSAFKQVEVTETLVYLYVSSVSAFIVPRRVFATGAEFDHFVATVEQLRNRSTASS